MKSRVEFDLFVMSRDKKVAEHTFSNIDETINLECGWVYAITKPMSFEFENPFEKYERDVDSGKYLIPVHSDASFLACVVSNEIADLYAESGLIVGELTDNDKKAISEAIKRCKERFELKLKEFEEGRSEGWACFVE
jgi:rRNA maturation protein Nop10